MILFYIIIYNLKIIHCQAQLQLQHQLQLGLRLALVSNSPTTQPSTQPPNSKSRWIATLITASTPGFDYNYKPQLVYIYLYRNYI